MTKLKSKKMTKSTFAIIIMAVVMVAMLAFGGTYAYFTATSAEVTSSNATTGIVKLGANSITTLTTDKVVYGTEILGSNGAVKAVNSSDVSVYVFVTFTANFTKATTEGVKDQPATLVKSVGDVKAEGNYYLEMKNGDNDITNGWVEISSANNKYVLGKLVTAAGDVDVCDSIIFYGWSQSTTTSTGTEQGSLMGATINLTIESGAIQTLEGSFSTANEADVKAAHTAYLGTLGN